MQTDAASAMLLARKNFSYLAEAMDEAHLAKLKGGALGYNHSLMVAGWIDQGQLDQLNLELEAACEARARDIPCHT